MKKLKLIVIFFIFINSMIFPKSSNISNNKPIITLNKKIEELERKNKELEQKLLEKENNIDLITKIDQVYKNAEDMYKSSSDQFMNLVTVIAWVIGLATTIGIAVLSIIYLLFKKSDKKELEKAISELKAQETKIKEQLENQQTKTIEEAYEKAKDLFLKEKFEIKKEQEIELKKNKRTEFTS